MSSGNDSSNDNGTDNFDYNQYEFDPSPADTLGTDIATLSPEETARINIQDPTKTLLESDPRKRERIAVIRTSDRIMFRRCRRRWGWQSHMRANLGPRENASPLWMGSGFHFALEDFHGEKRFPSASAAFDAYVEATKRHDRNNLPVDWAELHTLSRGMLDYYEHQWLRYRDPLKTFVFNGVPQVEVNFRVEIPFENTALLNQWGYDRVVYSGTLDRVCIDEYDQLWIVEYKTAKTIQTLHLANDSQVSSYCWAGQYLYGQPIVGVIYQQHRKELPHQPKILGSGRLSVDKRQLVTFASVRDLAIKMYGSVQNAPGDVGEFLSLLASTESPKADKFVQRNYIQRNQHQCEAEGVKILMEVEEMLNPDLPLYPNPDRTCQFMCPFNGPCVSLDDGSDWAYELELLMKPRERVYDSWRHKIEWPGQAKPQPLFDDGQSNIIKTIDYTPAD